MWSNISNILQRNAYRERRNVIEILSILFHFTFLSSLEEHKGRGAEQTCLFEESRDVYGYLKVYLSTFTKRLGTVCSY